MANWNASSAGAEFGVIALEQRFAADAMQFRFERPVARAFGRRRTLRRGGGRHVRIALSGLGLGQYDLQQSIEPQNVLFAQEFDRPAHV